MDKFPWYHNILIDKIIYYINRRNSVVKLIIILIAKNTLVVGKEIQERMGKVDLQWHIIAKLVIQKHVFNQYLRFSVRTYPRKIVESVDTKRIVGLSQSFFLSPQTGCRMPHLWRAGASENPPSKTPCWIIDSLYLGNLRGMHLKADPVRLVY